MSVGNTQIFKKRKDGKMDTPFSPNCSLILTRSLPPTIPTVTFCSGTNRNFTYELGQKTAVRTSRSVFMKVNIVSSASCQKRTVSLKESSCQGLRCAFAGHHHDLPGEEQSACHQRRKERAFAMSSVF